MCDYFEHMGDFKIYAECDSTKVFKNGNKPGVFPLLIGLIENLVKTGISEEEMRLTKSYLKSKMQLKAEECDVIAKHNGKSALFGLPDTRYGDTYKICIEPITKKQIDECIQKYFRRDGMTVSVISSNSAVTRQSNYEKIVNAMNQKRNI